ncbi:MAG TPA: sigma-54 dependent transcriptional regulator [Armatimonadota bacterium]|jgi:DNA-binding NtrC family response regulator
MRKILVVEDEAALRSMLVDLLDGLGYQVVEASDGAMGWELAQAEEPDLVITDVSMPRMKGIDLLGKVKSARPETPVIVITGYASLKLAVEAVRMGAYSFVQKPFEIDEIQRIVEAALEHTRVLDDNKYLRQQLKTRFNFDNRIGSSKTVQEAYVMAARAAPSNASVLILGETGTGKEYLARTIHYASPRADGPFIKVSCAALPETLLESELFGHEKGSFTNALNRRIGRFEMANGGTLLLDEIGDISLPTQIKLLRVLQEKEFERLGGAETIRSDVRIVAATNKDLGKAVEEGAFRSDLLYRLNVLTISLPPLRERGDDMEEYASFFLDRANAEAGRNITGFSDTALKAMREYPWPGNIRELENAVNRAVILCMGETIQAQDLLLPDEPIGMPTGPSGRFRTMRQVQLDHLAAVLKETDGDEEQAARILDVCVEDLRRLRAA